MRITRDQLLEMDESRLRRDVLLPLFREMGFKDVFEYHGHAMEQGKDIVMWTADLAGTRINYIAVVKAKPISGQVSGKGGAGEVFAQVHQSFGSAYIDPHGTEQRTDRCFVVCPHQIKKEALAALKSGLGEEKFSKVTILSGDQLWEQIDTHLSERTLISKAEDLRRRLIDSRIEGARVIIDAQHVRVELPPGDGESVIRASFQFPTDAKGRAAFEALQRHIDTGEPVVIEGEYVVEWTTPETMVRLFGEERPSRIEIGPAETPEVLFNDAHANLQVTFMRDKGNGALAADIDVDESSGIKHGFEVIHNAVFRSRTNPFLIHEFLLSAHPVGKSLDPGYTFRF